MTDPVDLPPFSAFLAEQRKGDLNAEATAALAEVVRAVSDTGKPGSVTVKITISPITKGQPGDQVVISDQVNNKPPREDQTALWYVTDGGGVSRRGPHQMSITDSDLT